MKKRRVVLCDDDGSRVKRWQVDIESVPGLSELVEVHALTPREFADAYEALKMRQVKARKTDEADSGTDAASVLDDADIVIVDFDLTPREQAELFDAELDQLIGSFGDVFAYLTRCYSQAGFTVLVNQTFFQSTFDLTMTEFDVSFADLNITDMDLGRSTLWFGSSEAGRFRPWHWPRLVDAAEHMRALQREVSLDAPVFDALELEPQDVINFFDAKQLEPLGIDMDPGAIERITFRDLAAPKCHYGIRSQSEKLSVAGECRVAAAALFHWLERSVLPAQNVLVDAPHLIERRPHLAPEAEWAALTGWNDAEIEASLDVSALSSAAMPNSWFPRPVWFWPECPEASLEYQVSGDLVFCEDVSTFLPADQAVDFRSSVAGPWAQRFVSRELVDGESTLEDPRIEYRPETRFYG